MYDINSMSRNIPWSKAGTTYVRIELELQDKGHAIEELIVCYI